MSRQSPPNESPWVGLRLTLSIERGRGASRALGRFRAQAGTQGKGSDQVTAELGPEAGQQQQCLSAALRAAGETGLWFPESQRNRVREAVESLLAGPAHGRAQLTLRGLPRKVARERQAEEKRQREERRAAEREAWLAQLPRNERQALLAWADEALEILPDLQRAASMERQGIINPWRPEPPAGERASDLAAVIERHASAVASGDVAALERALRWQANSGATALEAAVMACSTPAEQAIWRLPKAGSLPLGRSPQGREAKLLALLGEEPSELSAVAPAWPMQQLLEAAKALHGGGLIELQAEGNRLLARRIDRPCEARIWLP